MQQENYTQYVVEYFFFEGLSPLYCHFKNYNVWIDAVHLNTYLHWAALLWTLQSPQAEEDEICHKVLQADLAANANKYSSLTFMGGKIFA